MSLVLTKFLLDGLNVIEERVSNITIGEFLGMKPEKIVSDYLVCYSGVPRNSGKTTSTLKVADETNGCLIQQRHESMIPGAISTSQFLGDLRGVLGRHRVIIFDDINIDRFEHCLNMACTVIPKHDLINYRFIGLYTPAIDF